MIGWIGSLMLAFCGLPQAIKSIRDKHSSGLDYTFLTLWTLGEILTLIAISKDASNLVYLMFNYGSNLLFLSVIWFYKIFPRSN
jgi:uncharacterized protein with PQ loop repeat